MRRIPQASGFGSTWGMFHDPYRFISKTCRRLNSDVFQTRLLFRKVLCLSGREAGEVFYDPQRFKRKGVAPGRLQKTLFGQGGVPGLDGLAHQHRKQLFLSILTPESVADLAELTEEHWRTAVVEWPKKEWIELYPQFQRILCRAICEWAGLPLGDAEVNQRTTDLTELFDYAATIGPKHWLARRARQRANRWMETKIGLIREGKSRPTKQSAVFQIAWHRDVHGKLIDGHVAAVELLNVLRPVVAVSVYVVFVAHALHRFPESRDFVKSGDDQEVEAFVQEVRRFYPFFPFVAAEVRKEFEWNDYRFPAGRVVLFDLYGTNHDGRIWERAEEFLPQRFLHTKPGEFNFVPQGGGDRETNHRCPGEEAAIELMKRAARFFVQEISYEVPPQDLDLQWSRLPPVPSSGFVVSNVVLHRRGGHLSQSRRVTTI